MQPALLAWERDIFMGTNDDARFPFAPFPLEVEKRRELLREICKRETTQKEKGLQEPRKVLDMLGPSRRTWPL